MMPNVLGSDRELSSGKRLARVAGLIFYLLSAQALLTAGVGLSVYFAGGSAADLVLPATSLFLASSYAVVGYFLRRYRVMARNFAFAFAAVSLFAFFPAGTILGVAIALCIHQANRERVFFDPKPVSVAAPSIARVPESAPLLVFEPELATETAR